MIFVNFFKKIYKKTMEIGDFQNKNLKNSHEVNNLLSLTNFLVQFRKNMLRFSSNIKNKIKN